MTTIRGKEPIELTDCPSVETLAYSQQVIVTTGGWCNDHPFTAKGKLSVTCAKNLIRELRKALHRIRDETRERLDKAVSDAEGPL